MLLLAAALVLQARTWGDPDLQCLILDRRIDESSGIARSHTKPNVYYTHNDSGDKPRFFKFSEKGIVSGWYLVNNASAIDWEDMASAVVEGKPRLFLADIGDNAAKRAAVQVYVVDEPSGAYASIAAKKYELRYPDRPHDAEAFMVHPQSGDWYIVTKERQGATQVFRLPFKPTPGSYTLESLGTIVFTDEARGGKLVTGGDISPDGKFVVVRTYTAAYEFAVSGEFKNWFHGPGQRVKTAFELQGEAICYSADGRSLLTTSEFVPCAVSRMRLR